MSLSRDKLALLVLNLEAVLANAKDALQELDSIRPAKTLDDVVSDIRDDTPHVVIRPRNWKDSKGNPKRGYAVDWTDRNGKRMRRQFGTIEDAEALKARILDLHL